MRLRAQCELEVWTLTSLITDLEFLQEITYERPGAKPSLGADPEVEVQLNEEIDSRRWVSLHRVVWVELETEKYYELLYERPLTELQEGSESEIELSDIREVQRKVEVKEVVSYV